MDKNKDKDKDTSKDTHKDKEKDMNKDMDKDKDQDQDKNCILKVSDKNVCRDYTATYKNPGSLKTHMVKIHLYKNIEFLCEICNNTFDTVQKLSRHKKSHVNIQLYHVPIHRNIMFICITYFIQNKLLFKLEKLVAMIEIAVENKTGF